MHSITRRGFLAASAALSAPLQAHSLQAIGVQVYTVRNVLPQKPLETLKALEQIGYKELEMGAAGLDKIWPSVLQTSLKPVGLHLDTPLFTHKQDQLPAALEDAKKKGFEYVLCPYIDPKDRGGEDVMKQLAANLNKAGEQCRAMGLTLAYHNHAFEFAPSGSGTLLDVLLANTDPKLVSLEMDIMWVTVGGGDPAALLEKYKGRVPLMHVKNVAAGVATRFNEQVPKEAFKEAGAGVIDIPKVLAAARKTGVKHYFVEQDQVPGDPLVSLKQSYDYLSKLNF
jgi:sugar phosphate isomerase/epimerase